MNKNLKLDVAITIKSHISMHKHSQTQKFSEEIFDVFRYGVCGYKVYLIFSGRVFFIKIRYVGSF